MSERQSSETGPREEEIIIIEILDIEEHAKKHGDKPPKARRYIIRIDREKYTVEVPGMLGKDILALAGKTPDRYLLNQKFRHGQVAPIEPTQHVDFTAPGVERFITLPKDQTEGRDPSRQQFKLPEEDVAQLQAGASDWETVPGNWLLVHGFPVPDGYNTRSVSVALQIPAGYPTAALDMAYFHPSLQLSNGRPIPAVSSGQIIEGKNWQRWSRHYTPQHPWLPGEYSVATHLSLVQIWLERELARG
jgi:Prokaryotic E2 family E/Multiubiquitin